MSSSPIKKFTDLSQVPANENAQTEESILQFWAEQNIFEKTLTKDAPAGEYHFFEGPPTANGRPGIHHVAARSFKDIIPRYKTMRGFRVHRKAGWDTHGLPVELQVEKELGLKSKKEIEQFGVATFNHKCRESVWTYKDEWEALTARMGYWLDMEHPYVTYTNDYIEGVWSVVKKISERTTNDGKDLLYKDFKILPWCSRCGTALSSHELNQPGAYQDVKDVTAFVKFPIVGFEKAYFLAWTTTPWTLPGNVALAVGVDIDYVEAKVGDEIVVLAKELTKILPDGFEIIAEHKGSEMVGMKYEPLYPFMSDLLPADQESKKENAFKVYAADFVTTTDGTGIVHIAPMYGADDFDLATKYDLPKFHVVGEDGKYIAGCDTTVTHSSVTGLTLSGRYVKETDGNPAYAANGKPTVAIDIINDLTARNLLFKKENYVHSYPHCWRCETPLLYYARGSWYFRMSALREKLLAANESINWEPDHIKAGRFGEWLDGIKDWAISRDRYWGTPLPVWETADRTKKVVVGGVEDLKKYAKKSGNKYFVMRHGQAESNLTNTWDFQGDATNHLTEEGRNQVSTSSVFLKDKQIDVVVHSSIVRTTETAQIALQNIGGNHELIIDDRIIEWQVGSDFQGKNLQEYLTLRNAAENRYTFKHGDGESYADLIKRCGDFLYELETKYQGKNILIVTHNSSARGLDLVSHGFTFEKLLQNPPKEYPWKNAEIRELDFVPLPHNENYELDFHKPYIDQIELVDPETGEPLKRAAEVMDVWFDSGAMPYAQSHVLGTPTDFHPMPADYIAEGVDQTRGWFYTMHAIANLLNDQPTNNYKNVVCLGLLMAADGTKMSKSRGNTVSPWEVFQKFGADVARFWFYSVNAPGETKNFDEKSLDEVNKKVFNPLRNVVSFYEMYKGDINFDDDENNPYSAGEKNILDTWILALFDTLEISVTKHLDEYNVLEPARAIREFINELSTWYIRRSRDRFKSDDLHDRKRALRTTRIILNNLARVMAPFTPFIAEEIWQKVSWSKEYAPSVHLAPWLDRAKAGIDWGTVIADMEKVREVVTLGLEARQKANIKVRQPLASLTIATTSLGEEYLDIIKDELNVKQVRVDVSQDNGTVSLDIEITEELRNEGDMRDMVRTIQDMRKAADLVPSDRVIVTLTHTEPAWYRENQILTEELLATVGAQEVRWGGALDQVEKV